MARINCTSPDVVEESNKLSRKSHGAYSTSPGIEGHTLLKQMKGDRMSGTLSSVLECLKSSRREEDGVAKASFQLEDCSVDF